MWLTEYLVDFLSWWSCFLFYFHAVIGSFCTFYMKVYLTILLCTLNDCSDIWSFLAAYYTSNIEFAVVKFIHLDRGSRGDLRSWHPQRAAMMYPVVERIRHWAVFVLKLSFILLQEMAIILGDAVVLLLMLIEIQLKLVLVLHELVNLAWFRRLLTFLFSLFYRLVFFVILLINLLFVCLLSLEKLI